MGVNQPGSEGIAALMNAHLPATKSISSSPASDVLADIYNPAVNLAIWQRPLPGAIHAEVAALLSSQPTLKLSREVTVDNCIERLQNELGPLAPELYRDIQALVDMYTCLFELDAVGLRLTALDRAMCPRFHVDKVPCRLVTTYTGPASEFLDNRDVDRSKLGPGPSQDFAGGLYPSTDVIFQTNSGDVCLLKGERWIDNEGKGIVHRSPQVPEGEKRLVMTLDMC
ncbi:DUF1826 domain-containing protein [Oceanobacter kriegii]|uniref:DUF1826 domain-containing protein n=1 Tax=Oceanobacter kriegii TaxID=64972 RepID=UPI00040A2188|nr:DUF1826 domain-containing protein [Oceanobacter kriegii]